MKYLDKRPMIGFISLALGGLVPVTTAQDANQAMEEVVVTGIRASVISAQDVRRDEDGVVDAITAEDIGKFPDSNLAESLQRVPGVSIDRSLNEGNQVTVRGLGPNFNMVTLNGRQMPAASSPEQESISSATQSRAFNFNQVASESVSSVLVYKTARANLTPGGMGATIDIQTARPFDYEDTKFVLSAAGVHDSSVRDGDDVTPEVGGLFSTQLMDGRLGILLSGSLSERQFSEPTAHTDGWLRDDAGTGDYNSWCGASDCADAPYIYRPVSNIGDIQHNERTRINGQAVVQFAPSEDLQLTLDYVYSSYELDQVRYQTGLFGTLGAGSAANLVLDENYSVLSYTRLGGATDTLQYRNETVIENDSLGLNVEWQANENLTVTVDVHSSTAESQPDGELSDRNYIIQGTLGNTFDLGYSASGIDIAIDDTGAYRGTCQYGIDAEDGFGYFGERGASEPGCGRVPGVDGIFDPSGYSGLGSVFRTIGIENSIDQFQLDFTWRFDDTEFSVGAMRTDYEVDTLATYVTFQFQGLSPCVSCDETISEPVPTYAPSAFQQTNIVDLPGFIGATGELFLGDGPSTGNWPLKDGPLLDAFPPTYFGAVEESTAAYFNISHDFELADMPARISAGMRYEETDVAGSAFQNFPQALTIFSATEGTIVPSDETTFFTVDGGYKVFLPALDLRVEPVENHVARISYGKSIARPDLNGLRPTTSVSDFRPGTATASSGNPDLNPYQSDNLDLSYEWYYDEGSYVSVAYFFKQIDDYIATDIVQDIILDVNGDPLRNPEGRFDPGPINPTPVTSQATDPVALFDVTRLVNGEQREVDGLELAVQHLFGDSGFGVQANLTLVDSDASFDAQELGNQAILIGLSDSWNLIGFFENESFSVRVAANYRDEFLFATNQLRATNEPVYFDEYLQVDMSASWNYSDDINVFFEVLNITGEDQRQVGRFDSQFLFENDQDPRFTLGIRADF